MVLLTNKDSMNARNVNTQIPFPKQRRKTMPSLFSRLSFKHDTVYEKTPDYYLKIVLLGDAKTGKTTLASLFTCNACKKCRRCSDGSRRQELYADKTITVRDKLVLARLYDTAGQEKYRSLTASYYRGAHGCLLLFDVTKESSFDNVQYWLHDLREYTSQPDICVILVGTKCHVSDDKREVTYDRAHKFAESISVPYMEVSAEEGINVTEVFEKLADNVIDSLSKDQPSLSIPTKSLTLDMPKSKKQWCSC